MILAFSLWPASALEPRPLSFALIGDTPYSAWERAQLPLMLQAMAGERLAFVIHVGDIKNGGSVCSDEVFLDVLSVFQAAPLPLIYVPGDNEWTDCHRSSNGRYDPIERLTRLRELFFAGETSLGQPRMALVRQSRDPVFASYRENVRWEMGGVLFVGLNVPGSQNNYHGQRNSGGPVPEYLERSAANRVWLRQAFALARQRQLAGILIAIQGNPEFEAVNAGHARPGYAELIAQLRNETERFAGQVVLVHGDTHMQQINQPLMDAQSRSVLRNFTRVETYGFPFMGWVRGTADVSQPGVFGFVPMRWTPPTGPSP